MLVLDSFGWKKIEQRTCDSHTTTAQGLINTAATRDGNEDHSRGKWEMVP